MQRIDRHRACQGCGYDLFSLPRDGRCPECGRGVAGIHRPRRPKNPKRQAGQWRRMIRNHRRDVWWLRGLWILPLCGVAACWWWRASVWLWAFAIIAVVSGAIQHLGEANAARDWRKRIQNSPDDRGAA